VKTKQISKQIFLAKLRGFIYF